jgi:hypothetical protein
MDIITQCPFCGVAHIVTIRSADDYITWRYDGVSAQDAFPYLNAEERELLISGICSDCWDKLDGIDDEDDFIASEI